MPLDQIHHDSTSNAMNMGVKRHGGLLIDPSLKRRAAFEDITNSVKENQGLKDGQKKKTSSGQKGLKPSQGKVVAVEKPRPKLQPTTEDKENSSTLKKKSCFCLRRFCHHKILHHRVLSPAEASKHQRSISEEIDELELLLEEEQIDDIDKENLGDPAQAAVYAKDIFEYYKEREVKFNVDQYMSRQPHLTPNMRSILVDWLVEVQENFELNHETLYLAVKLVDTYLSRKQILKEVLQLVGAVSLFVACKFDERCPPLIEDFLYICDDAYTRQEFIQMEMNILRIVGFDLGMPLSYRFLRRYAKCARAAMETLTLARYILEMSLMEYSLLSVKESKLGAATLYLALCMKKEGTWTRTMVHFTGYEVTELRDLSRQLNTVIKSPPNKQLTTIRSKYAHKVFYEVAKTTTIDNNDL
ncbi:LOW QUALITY PROTEIN: G2/mitotic-specific cyclin-B3-like [Haliotis rubra]|uniref:LOW QUALITY PROTEIN: G2/mitotic-specific cyclin-B3-like n=1 Tax=Haliotis rubra TaxID=36100 RepID=UPI001EE50F2B|nr:LOW QUALITY PROTEIN: G2/mitotic-specific cyclin-B3-like [Haliotis rubra]